jgi:transposase InsO family protein
VRGARRVPAGYYAWCPAAGLLHHSDQGGTYASHDYQRVLDGHGITCSMSRRGNCHGNAVMEAFFSSLKSELADRFDSGGEAKLALFDCLEVFYNHRRRHSTIGYRSPAACERDARNGAWHEGALVGTLAPSPSFTRRGR